MCKPSECPRMLDCYRFVAEPDYLQSYFINTPRKDNRCEYFIKALEVDVIKYQERNKKRKIKR